jgi:hypothetical protein
MKWKYSTLAGLLITTSAPALAQTPQGGPPLGSVDSTAVVRGNRDNQESYNRTSASMNATARDAAKLNGAAPAARADLVAGKAVRDSAGVNIGTIEKVDDTGVVIRAGNRIAKVPLNSFGKDQDGLLIAITAAQFNEALAKTAQTVPVVDEPEPATLADIKPGSTLRDIDGVQIGTINKLVDGGVLVASEGKILKFSVDSFGKDSKGLLLGITASEFKALINRSGRVPDQGG